MLNSLSCLPSEDPYHNYTAYYQWKGGGGGGGGGESGGRRTGRLARRARSFKEDFLDILSQMRSPGGGSGSGGGGSTGGGSPRPPRSPKPRTASSSDLPEERSPLADLDLHVKQVQLALKHFRDVVSRNKLEVLPGNGTIVLESIAVIQSLLKTYVFIDQSTALTTATREVYQSLMKLIQLCDDVLIGGEKILNKDTVHKVLKQVDEAVIDLVRRVRGKIAEERSLAERSLYSGGESGKTRAEEQPLRSSLPDIPLTPRERHILELSSSPHVAYSSEYLPPAPPKPPLPITKVWLGESPPPLPPKKKSGGPGSGGPPSQSLERLSLRSDTSSLGSLDSILNTSSRTEGDGEEDTQSTLPHSGSLLPHALGSDSCNFGLGLSSGINGSQTSSCCWDSSCSNTSDPTQLTESPDPLPSSNNSTTGFSLLTDEAAMAFLASGLQTGAERASTTSSGFVSIQQSSSTSFNMSKSSTVCYNWSSTAGEERRVDQLSESTACTTLHQRSSTTSTATTLSSQLSVDLEGRSGGEETSTDGGETEAPPALPEKKRSRRERQPSQYDNVPSPSTAPTTTTTTMAVMSSSVSPTSSSADSKPPPLPLKKKHIMAYMEMFGNCSQTNGGEVLRHSVHTYLQGEWHGCGSNDEGMRRTEQRLVSAHSSHSCSFTRTLTLPSTFTPHFSRNEYERGVSLESSGIGGGEMTGSPPALPPKKVRPLRGLSPPAPTGPPLSASPPTSSTVSPQAPSPVAPPPIASSTPMKERPDTVPMAHPALPNAPLSNGGIVVEVDCLYDLDVTRLLVFKRPDEEGPIVRGGHPIALLIHATNPSKNDFLYQEAFLTTYRTFMSPLEIVEKLCGRHQRFNGNIDPVKQRAARESFSLLVRVASDLTVSDLEDTLLKTLMDFVYQLVESGDLTMARVLRVIILDKYNTKQQYYATSNLLPSQNIYTRQSSLIDFKSEHVAEQMTLLDSDLFMKIEIPEVLIWAQEQNEERSPNLTRFTEHFNKMSYWARSRILEQTEAKERERYVVKFIKIMKHLRKINNFNSYLALLSALDSAPIRRLEWQKHITDGLKEYCALIDSSSSFRAYRQALADTQPPCIPYIGLVLQDLTFVHIGNSDYLSENIINFSKRWQQFNIVENMKRFKKGTYNFKKNERIIAFFNNFDDCLCEEAMWQISESIKPRGSKKLNQ